MLIVYLLWVAVVLLVWKISRQYYKKEISAHELMVWVFFWLMVGLGSIFVRKLDTLAQYMGVERAVDLLMYAAVVVLFYVVYRIYVKMERMERDITKLVRTRALENAQRHKSDICQK